jgi:hypothetical protein
MRSKKEPKVLPRRAFLKAAGFAGGALGVAAASFSTESAKASVGNDKANTSGYRETEHVRTYYRLAQF